MSDEKSASQVADELVEKAHKKFQNKNYTAALQLCQAALAIYEGIGNPVGIESTLINIGQIFRGRGPIAGGGGIDDQPTVFRGRDPRAGGGGIDDRRD
ncbi:tetratricopeptide repeat protein [Microcoleus sp. Pol11C1]|uniref:tetratricopeptide repeat protein n=1 Tax=unclassified Microcoleus TaxID=2642155 RepID=UPI002FD4606A